MKLKFDPSLEYQQDAIQSVVDAFVGQASGQSDFAVSNNIGTGLKLSETGVSNNIMLSDEQLLENIQKIQEANDIEKISQLQGIGKDTRQFSIEMETGTGKTYIYLRTIFELSKTYGFKKFIVVVPSLAIREGVLKSIEIMQEHFQTIYGNEPFNYFVYDPKRLTKVREFSSSNKIQIMVINIQSFIRDTNIMNRESEKMGGQKPIEFIQSAKPILIIDEPQSVDNTELAKNAIANLHPSATLRYSATHRNFYNLLYRLDPIRAYDLRLVKRIEVASVNEDENFNDAYIKLLKVEYKKGIRAQVEIHQEKNGTTKPTKVWIKLGTDLYEKSGKREMYRNGYVVQEIDAKPGIEIVVFTGGASLELSKMNTIGGLTDDILRAQIYETVERHLKKEKALKGTGIKVLSLFFIDKVSNYRIYKEDAAPELGKFGKWFEEIYAELTAKSIYNEFAVSDVKSLHNGYFSKDKSGHFKDTKGNTADDEDTYNIIMREKELLLDESNPLKFIFSHSALREGWDNPNVFQICTLNESQSVEKKRQEIGRGLRLPVNNKGERVHDENINQLTVIANESYELFARTLQSEFEQDSGVKFGYVDKIAFAKIIRIADDGEENPIGQETSLKIWEELKNNGYIDGQGSILSTFAPENMYFQLKIDNKYEDIVADIIDVVNSYIFKNRVRDAREKRTLKFNKNILLNEEFSELWEKIKQRTRYCVRFDTNELITSSVSYIKDAKKIHEPKINVELVEVGFTKAGISPDRKIGGRSQSVNKIQILPDLLSYLQDKTELTRTTLIEILKKSGRIADFQTNPQQFMELVAREITRGLRDMMLAGISYEKIKNHYWEMRQIEAEAEKEIIRYMDNLYEVKNQEKTLFDMVECDSEVEKQFAKDLDSHENVRLFVKLPSWFKIDTPIGPYNPDWAFVTQRDEKLYFVRETKSTQEEFKLRKEESHKIKYGKRHFKTIDVDFDVVTKLSEVGI